MAALVEEGTLRSIYHCNRDFVEEGGNQALQNHPNVSHCRRRRLRQRCTLRRSQRREVIWISLCVKLYPHQRFFSLAYYRYSIET